MQLRGILISLFLIICLGCGPTADTTDDTPNFSQSLAYSAECCGTAGSTFTVDLPALPGNGEDEIITIPNNRPIYALIVHGYNQNLNFNQLLTYNFAKHLMEKGAYVHYAWWNNLCSEYMARPLHQDNSHPGDFNLEGLVMPDHGDKAVPADDYQFQADAELFLQAIRCHNPSAIIILVGHSMGGGAVARLATNTEIVIDLLAPIDPVDNRGKPEGPLPDLSVFLGPIIAPPVPPTVWPDYNYTRWRIAHDEFQGYKYNWCLEPGIWPGCNRCGGAGEQWHDFYDLIPPYADYRLYVCGGRWTEELIPRFVPYPFMHDPPRRLFRSNVINLFHRYQKEYVFPFDYKAVEHFDHAPPPGGSSSQGTVSTCWIGLTPWGWLCLGFDGHGEIVGFYGTDPEALQAQDWPTGLSDSAVEARRELLIEMADAPNNWTHRPEHPEFCLVSDDLIALFDRMNHPPIAIAGEDQVVECTGAGAAEVTLDGSASTDPDNDDLSYTWQGPFGEISGQTITVTLGLGTHDITLTVSDPSGHIDCDMLEVMVVDTQPPELEVVLSPSSLWPPNHKMVPVIATVSASDNCDEDPAIVLTSVVSSEPDDAKGGGDGKTTNDIQDADIGNEDYNISLRAERQGKGDGRIYTITYEATDDSGNSATASATVTVPHNQ
jgi:pimeloyl-ACP methyl ester carboxylesterase